MPNRLSAYATKAALALSSEDAWLFLVRITHKDLPAPLFWVNNTEPITCMGETYVPYPITVTLHNDEAGVMPEFPLVIDNVHRDLMEIIRTSTESPKFTLKLVLSSKPDDIELQIFGLTLLDVSYDAYVLTGTLFLDDLLNTRYPADVVSIAAGYQGMFRQ